MSLIEQLQKISAKIFQESIKTYQLKDLIRHRHAKPHSLTEYLSMYPNKGLGFHIRRRTWPQSMYIRIVSSQYKSNRFGSQRGMQYFNNRQQWKMPKKVPGAGKRGIWAIAVGDAKDVELDNGMVYTTKDYEAYIQFRKRWDPKPLPVQALPEGEEAAAEGQAVENAEGEAQPEEQPQK